MTGVVAEPAAADRAEELPEPEIPVVAVNEPAGGTPPLVDSPEMLAETVRLLASGTGSFAVDAERAAGFRYSQRAYLIQVRRSGAGTHLIDPIPLTEHMSELRRVMASDDWILHAASQDLPCLRDLGLEPPSLFDTELAGRLLGRSRVGLGTMVASEIGVGLAKEHSASDWSARPISVSELNYAALDVEYLIPLRDSLSTALRVAGKSTWAEEEFEYVRTAPPAPARSEPWRRTHSIGEVRTQRGLAIVREMWFARDAMAQARDISPGKLVNDRAIVALASREPFPATLPASREWRRGDPAVWEQAYQKALSLPTGELPARRGPSRGGLPEPRVWSRANPPAAARLTVVREAMAERSEVLSVPQEYLLGPAAQRRIAWEVTSAHETEVAAIAQAQGARRWQIDNAVPAIAEALVHLAKRGANR